MRELADDDVEFAVAEGKVFGVGFAEFDVDLRDARIFAGALKKLRGEVDGFDAGSKTGSGDGDNAGAAADVEDSRAGRDSCEAHEARGGWSCYGFERGEMLPAFFLCFLELSDAIHEFLPWSFTWVAVTVRRAGV